MTDANWNATELTFVDISVEASRTYHFPTGGKHVVLNPTHLHVSASGGHRIKTADGSGVYIPGHFIAITWTPKAGQPTFVA